MKMLDQPLAGGHSFIKRMGDEVWKIKEDDFEWRTVKKIPPGLDTIEFLRLDGSFMITRYIPGNRLTIDLIKTKAWDQWKSLFQTLFRTLLQLHKVGIVHGDLCFNNIILTPYNRLILIDFGSSPWSGSDVEEIEVNDDLTDEIKEDIDQFKSLICTIAHILFDGSEFDSYLWRKDLSEKVAFEANIKDILTKLDKISRDFYNPI